jgi:hypothetical protein
MRSNTSSRRAIKYAAKFGQHARHVSHVFNPCTHLVTHVGHRTRALDTLERIE